MGYLIKQTWWYLEDIYPDEYLFYNIISLLYPYSDYQVNTDHGTNIRCVMDIYTTQSSIRFGFHNVCATHLEFKALNSGNCDISFIWTDDHEVIINLDLKTFPELSDELKNTIILLNNDEKEPVYIAKIEMCYISQHSMIGTPKDGSELVKFISKYIFLRKETQFQIYGKFRPEIYISPPKGWIIENGLIDIIMEYHDPDMVIHGNNGNRDLLFFIKNDHRLLHPIKSKLKNGKKIVEGISLTSLKKKFDITEYKKKDSSIELQNFYNEIAFQLLQWGHEDDIEIGKNTHKRKIGIKDKLRKPIITLNNEKRCYYFVIRQSSPTWAGTADHIAEIKYRTHLTWSAYFISIISPTFFLVFGLINFFSPLFESNERTNVYVGILGLLITQSCFYLNMIHKNFFLPNKDYSAICMIIAFILFIIELLNITLMGSNYSNLFIAINCSNLIPIIPQI